MSAQYVGDLRLAILLRPSQREPAGAIGVIGVGAVTEKKLYGVYLIPAVLPSAKLSVHWHPEHLRPRHRPVAGKTHRRCNDEKTQCHQDAETQRKTGTFLATLRLRAFALNSPRSIAIFAIGIRVFALFNEL